ncbi:MAG: hypothetical protein R3321_12310 [Nitrososphaeraceae archaeon]|nr:hypothetical protein [Nitrososphaeraceae archaeon]
MSLEEDRQNSKEELLDAIQKNKFDGVITINLIDKESETQYVPGQAVYTPTRTYSYYGSYWGYYNYWYPQVYRTGYIDVEKNYFLETNLFDAETEKLSWSAQSKTVDPVSLESFSEGFAQKIAADLKEDKLLENSGS